MGGVASAVAPAGALCGSLYGAGTGAVIGGVGSAMTGGDIKEGIIFGAATGLVGGGFQGYCSAKNQGLNPWTGAKLPETTVNTPNVPFEAQTEMSVAEKATTGGENVQGNIRSNYDSQESFFSNTKYTEKVQTQMKKGDFHSFPSSVEAFESNGIIEIIQGGDGIIRSKLSIPGYYRGRKGIFEFIKEPDGNINHRLFNIK